MGLTKVPFRLSKLHKLLNSSGIRLWISGGERAFGTTWTDMEESRSNKHFFEYTSGRWIYNEASRLAERHLIFDIDGLKGAAAESVNKPISDISNFQKLAEGGFNRVFEISMKDGTTILARLPYPSTLPRRLATASEAATLAFVSSCGIPVPRVLSYSVGDDAVGAEYLLMEKLPGKSLGDRWYDLSEVQRLKVLHQVVELEAKLFSARLPASGSIYYSHDLDPGVPKTYVPGSNDGLCIGPYAALRWWAGERGDLDVDRGPHEESCAVLQASAYKELAWIKAFGQTRWPLERAYRETFGYKKQNSAEHAKSLEEYICLAPYLVPQMSSLNQPVLRHPDFNPNNILVSEDLRITGIIDWQHASVLPTFLSAGIPNYFQNYDDEKSLSFVPPKLPHDYEEMDEEEKAEAQEKYRRRHIHFFYLGFTQQFNELHWHALEQQGNLLKRRIFDHAGQPWEGLNTPLQMDIAQLVNEWSNIIATSPDGTTPTCPVELIKEEIKKRADLDDSLRETDSEMERINRVLGVASDGWTSNENYEEAKARQALIREEGLAAVADEPWLRDMTDQHWPFDDYDEEEE